MPKNTRYTFHLVGVNIEKVDTKYGIGNMTIPNQTTENENIPEHATRIDDLDIVKKTPEIVSFLDESKRLRKCTISMIDFSSDQPIVKGKYKCYWDKHDIPSDIFPIGCPIRYVPSRATKSYHSEISQEQYTISEQITEPRALEITKRQDKRISVEHQNYYETDGVFCSFNCCMAYIIEPENKHNPMYRYSEMLLLQMYNDFVEQTQGALKQTQTIQTIQTIQEIMPAPHWRLLIDFGGTLPVDKFRESFNKILYVYHGLIGCRSVGRLYEDQIKF